MAFLFKAQNSTGAMHTKMMGSCREPENRLNAVHLKGKIWMSCTRYREHPGLHGVEHLAHTTTSLANVHVYGSAHICM